MHNFVLFYQEESRRYLGLCYCPDWVGELDFLSSTSRGLSDLVATAAELLCLMDSVATPYRSESVTMKKRASLGAIPFVYVPRSNAAAYSKRPCLAIISVFGDNFSARNKGSWRNYTLN